VNEEEYFVEKIVVASFLDELVRNGGDDVKLCVNIFHALLLHPLGTSSVFHLDPSPFHHLEHANFSVEGGEGH
jgi:hypothetical protein